MAGTLSNAIGYPVVGSGAGQISTALDIELFLDFMEPVEPHEHEISQWLPKFEKDPNQIQAWTGQSYNPPITLALSVATANNSNVLTFATSPADAGFRVNDIVESVDYFSGQTMYTIASTYERGRITAINALSIEIDRHSGQLTSGNWFVHPIGTAVTVVSRAVPYRTAFDNAPVWRGDAIYNVPQRIPTGFLRMDKAMLNTPTQEATNLMQQDMTTWRARALDFREDAWINGVRILPTDTIAGQCGGMLWWASQISSNILDLRGRQISPMHIVDRLFLKRKQHKKRAGKTVITDLDTMNCLDVVLEPFKEYNSKDNTVNIEFKGVNSRWGNVTFMPVETFPPGTMLITDKGDWQAGNYAGMDWDIVEQEEKETGGPWVTWSMYGDFTLRCRDVYRQILIKNINTNADWYKGRRVFAVA